MHEKRNAVGGRNAYTDVGQQGDETVGVLEPRLEVVGGDFLNTSAVNLVRQQQMTIRNLQLLAQPLSAGSYVSGIIARVRGDVKSVVSILGMKTIPFGGKSNDIRSESVSHDLGLFNIYDFKIVHFIEVFHIFIVEDEEVGVLAFECHLILQGRKILVAVDDGGAVSLLAVCRVELLP